MLQLLGIGFLFLCIATTGSASRREELERAAELAVERAAERVAEKAVEKALESGNSTTVTETIRASHSSVRKYDSTKQLPGTIYTPVQKKEYDRIMKEREAGELAVAQIKRSGLFKRAATDQRTLNTEKIDDVSDRMYPIRYVKQFTYQNPYQHQFAMNNNDNRAAIPQDFGRMEQRDVIHRQHDKLPTMSPGLFPMEHKPMFYYISPSPVEYSAFQYPIKIMDNMEDQDNRNRRVHYFN